MEVDVLSRFGFDRLDRLVFIESEKGKEHKLKIVCPDQAKPSVICRHI